MRSRKNQTKSVSLQHAFLFFFIVSILLIGSGVIKLYQLMQKGTFDGDHRYTIIAQEEGDKKHASVISFAPDSKTITLLYASAEKELTIPQTAQALGILVDGYIISPERFSFKDDKDIAGNIRTLLLNFTAIETKLTVVDMARLWLYAKTVPPYNITTQNIDLETVAYISVDELLIDRISSRLFTDDTFLDEKMSIQIVNGTQVVGLGGKIARIITNSGGNVVSVITADKPINMSSIAYYGDETYTLKRLEKIFGFKRTEMQKAGISDIVITIGKDQEKAFVF